MLRLIIAGLLGYATYRVAREFVSSVPDNFEPVGVLPPPRRRAAHPATSKRAAGKS